MDDRPYIVAESYDNDYDRSNRVIVLRLNEAYELGEAVVYEPLRLLLSYEEYYGRLRWGGKFVGEDTTFDVKQASEDPSILTEEDIDWIVHHTSTRFRRTKNHCSTCACPSKVVVIN